MKKGMRNPLSGSELAILEAEGMRSQQAGRKLYAALGKPTPENVSDPEWVREYDAALRLFGRGETLFNYLQTFKKRRLDEFNNPLGATEIARLRKFKGIGMGGLRKAREHEDLSKDDPSVWWAYHIARVQAEASTTAIQWMIDMFTVEDPLPKSKKYGEQMAPPERERDDPNYWSQYNNPITSNQIALAFYRQGLAGKWLSAKQAKWLTDTFWRELPRGSTHYLHGQPAAWGSVHDESGKLIGSFMARLSPVNGAAMFQWTPQGQIETKFSKEHEEKVRGEFIRAVNEHLIGLIKVVNQGKTDAEKIAASDEMERWADVVRWLYEQPAKDLEGRKPADVLQEGWETTSTSKNPIHSLAHMIPPTSPHSFTDSHALDEPMLPRNPVIARPGEPFVWNYSSPPPNADVQHRAMALPPKPRKGQPGFFGRIWQWLNSS